MPLRLSTAVAGLSGGRYALGFSALILVGASFGCAALMLRRRWLPEWRGAPARLAEAVIGLGLLTAVLQVLGTVGLFRLVPILLASALIGAGGLYAGVGNARAAVRVAGGRAGVSWVRLGMAALAVAAVAAEWAEPTLISYRYGIRTFDSLWYHLPWAASFAQSGQITTLHFTDVEYLTAFYPATAELFHALGIVLFGGGDLLSPGLNLIWLGFVLLAAWCIGAPWRSGVSTLLGGALAMAMPMLLLSQGGSAANDIVGVFFLLAAVGLLVCGARERAALALAAIAAGIAVSVKLSLLAPVAALTVGVLAWRRSRRAALLWLVGIAVAGGFWYLRNLIAVGNPLPWLNLPGLAVPAAPLQAHTGFSIAHYLFASRAWRGLLEPGLSSGLGSWWWAVLGAVLAGPLLCLLPGAGARVRLIGAVALASTLAYLVTPETAAGPAGHPLGFAFNLRYSAPPLAMSLVAAPLAPVWRGQRGRGAIGAVLALILLATLAHSSFWPSRYRVGQLLVGAIVLALGLVWGWWAARTRPVRAAPVAAALTTLLVIGLLGYPGQRSYFRHRYTVQPGISHLSPVWAWFRFVRGSRVGIVGTFGGFFAYPLFGLLDSNHVLYIGAHGPHGSFSAIRTCRAWRTAVDRARLRYLVITPARDPWHPRVLTPGPERGWTLSDPAAVVALKVRAPGQPITVFRLRGQLNPATCG